MHYPSADQDDSFFEVIDVNKDLEGGEGGIEHRTYEDQRIQKVHVKASFADAILKDNILSAKRKKERRRLTRLNLMQNQT
ncbi:MAG: hypothetical protein GEU26_17420 [Nitrososphaeraceae archaeon]|nr:hypothetical protein [Nitrososphaeraceae archaeon]